MFKKGHKGAEKVFRFLYKCFNRKGPDYQALTLEEQRAFKKHAMLMTIVGVVIGVSIYIPLSFMLSKHEEASKLTYNQFLEKVETGAVESIRSTFPSGIEMTVKLMDGTRVKVPNPKYPEFKQEMLLAGVEVIETSSSSTLFSTITTLLLIGLMGATLVVTGKSLGGFTKKDPITDKPTTVFEDVAGLVEVKKDMELLVRFLKDPEVFKEKGAVLPKGVIFYGDPGTGKTLLAKAIAGEADVPFFSLSGSDFIEMFAGLGAKRVRDLFKKARKMSPCIVFIDEIDAVGGKRTEQIGNGESRQTINALLSEMDGFEASEGVLVICATNRLEDLDPALIRPGRFDKHIRIPLPQTAEERLAIINIYKKGRTFAEDIDFHAFAKETIGFSPADLEALLNEAALVSIQQEKEAIDRDCLDEAMYKKLLKGHAKQTTDRDEEELKLVAWHEAGHAVMARAMGLEVSKVTIIPSTTGTGGVNFIIPKKLGLYTVEELESQIKMAYAGRVAELLLLGDPAKVTTGAASDIEQATHIIMQMITSQGMSKTYGLLNLNQLAVEHDVVLTEAVALSSRLEAETLAYLTKHQVFLEAVATRLIEKETIHQAELDTLLAPLKERV